MGYILEFLTFWEEVECPNLGRSDVDFEVGGFKYFGQLVRKGFFCLAKIFQNVGDIPFLSDVGLGKMLIRNLSLNKPRSKLILPILQTRASSRTPLSTCCRWKTSFRKDSLVKVVGAHS